ncbi:hypothetical protein ACQEVG_02380 [Streptomyces sp. CA-135486]|uniref:hypothetical protein n=1 Tax=Streptomyces sp. CA-135486 TaxID=3240049 RepID=UPI003D8A4390
MERTIRTFKYRLRSPIGGLAADLSATARLSLPRERGIQIYRRVWLTLPPDGMHWRDAAWLCFGISLHSENLTLKIPDGLTVEVAALKFPLSDYSSEVAALAMDGWLREEFDLPDVGVSAKFTGGEMPYSFHWGGVDEPFSCG